MTTQSTTKEATGERIVSEIRSTGEERCETCKWRESEIGYYSPCPKHDNPLSSEPSQECCVTTIGLGTKHRDIGCSCWCHKDKLAQECDHREKGKKCVVADCPKPGESRGICNLCNQQRFRTVCREHRGQGIDLRKPTEVPQEGFAKRFSDVFLEYVVASSVELDYDNNISIVIGYSQYENIKAFLSQVLQEAEQKGYERGKLEGIDEAISTKNALSLSCEHQAQLRKAITDIEGLKKDDFGGLSQFSGEANKGLCGWCGAKEAEYHKNPCKSLEKAIYNEALDAALAILKKLI